MDKFIAKKDGKLSKFLLYEYNGKLSYSTFCKLLRNKDIKVNSKRVNEDLSLKVGDVVECYYKQIDKNLELLYSSEHMIAVFKPNDITSEDFYNKVLLSFPSAKAIHRLDRNTSGILVYALDNNSEIELLNAFKTHTVKKYYLAEVYGVLKEKQAVLTAYLVKNNQSGTVKVYDSKTENSLTVKTEYKVVKEYDNSSVLSILLHTGRTHQIRAHMAHIGHFVIGDGKYGDNAVNKAFKCKRQRLCAVKIEFNFDKDSPLYYLNGVKLDVSDKFKIE